MPACVHCGAVNQVDERVCTACGKAFADVAAIGEGLINAGIVCPNCDAYNEPNFTKCISCGESLAGITEFLRAVSSPMAPELDEQPSAPPIDQAEDSIQQTVSEPADDELPMPDSVCVPVNQPPSLDSESSDGLPSVPEPTREKSESELIDASQPKPEDYVSTTATLLEAVDRISDKTAPSQTREILTDQTSDQDNAESLHAQPARSEQDLRCAHCQAMIPSDAQFCLDCGRPASTRYQGQLRLVRCYGGGDRMERVVPIEPAGITIGRSQASLCITDDPYLSGLHLSLQPQGDRLLAEDLGSFNGSFIRIRDKTEIKQNWEFLAGSQRFCFLGLGGPTSDVRITNQNETRSFGGEIPRKLFVALRLLHAGADGQPVSGSVFLRQGPVLSIGRHDCDLSFPDDAAMAPVHLEVHIGASGVHLLPKSPSAEVFVNLSDKTELHNGDELQLGAQVFRVEL